MRRRRDSGDCGPRDRGPADPDRRTLMMLIGAALIPTLSACAGVRGPHVAAQADQRGPRLVLPPDVFAPTPEPPTTGPAAHYGLPAIPGPRPGSTQTLGLLPGHAKDLALTIDDGTDETVIAAYVKFATTSGIKLTFFPNGLRPGWTQHAGLLRPMIDASQVQIGNHTWSHPDVTTIGDAAVAEEISRNESFIQTTFGVTARPYFRPPYGAHDARTDTIAGELGYTSITLWYGTFGDSAPLTPAILLSLAQRWIAAHHIVLGHANHPTVVGLLDTIGGIIRERGLTTCTLDEAFGTSRAAG
jgi:peptidoglycan/xylan/chitin deacetylase (PgdA/CDA1 family)